MVSSILDYLAPVLDAMTEFADAALALGIGGSGKAQAEKSNCSTRLNSLRSATEPTSRNGSRSDEILVPPPGPLRRASASFLAIAGRDRHEIGPPLPKTEYKRWSTFLSTADTMMASADVFFGRSCEKPGPSSGKMQQEQQEQQEQRKRRRRRRRRRRRSKAMMNGMGGDQLSMSCRAPRTITTCGSVEAPGTGPSPGGLV